MTYSNLLEVVIPAYNCEIHIKETIDSIFKQKTNFDFTVHISDDCSTDTTFEICSLYQRIYKNIRITKQTKNLGMTKNQHFVITSANSKYIAYLDSDDIFITDNYLQNQVDFLENNQSVSCVFSNFEEYYQKDNEVNIMFKEKNKPPVTFNLHYYFQNSIPICNSSMIFRKKFNSEISPIFVDYFQYDWLLHIHHALNGNLGFNDFIGTRYRIHDNNATNIKYAEKKFKDAIKLIYSIKTIIPVEYHNYFKHPRHEMNSLAFYYLWNRKFLNFYIGILSG